MDSAGVMVPPEIAERLGGAGLRSVLFDVAPVPASSPHSDAMKRKAEEWARASYTMDAVKEDPRLHAYRNFYWRLGIDPTKTRPSSEALIRRVVRGQPLPAINAAVDAMNAVSVTSQIVFSLFDSDKLEGEVTLRKAMPGEPFHAIGSEAPFALEGNELVLADERGSISIYPHRDRQRTKVGVGCTRIFLVACGVKDIEPEAVERAMRECAEAVAGVCLSK